MKIEEKIANLLINRKKNISIAESCTGGLLSHRLTNISGSSSFLKVGLVTYSNESKEKILKVQKDILKSKGAASEQTAIQMAQGVRKLFKTDFGLSITGVAGPTGGTKKKPVGLVFIAVNTPVETICIECNFKGTRGQIKQQAATTAMHLLYEFLE